MQEHGYAIISPYEPKGSGLDKPLTDGNRPMQEHGYAILSPYEPKGSGDLKKHYIIPVNTSSQAKVTKPTSF